MSARTRAGLALIGACLALAAGLLTYLGTLQPWSPIPKDSHPERWWACHESIVDSLPTPPECMTTTPPTPKETP